MRRKPSYRELVEDRELAALSEWENGMRESRDREPLALDLLASIRVVGFTLLALIVLCLCSCFSYGAELSPSTCKVVEFSSRGEIKSSGSGVLVAKSNGVGYVLTAKHVAVGAPGRHLVCLFPRSRRFAYSAPTVDLGPQQIDLALLTIDAPQDIAPRPIAWRTPLEGEKLWQSGFGNSKSGQREWWSRVAPRVSLTENGDRIEFVGKSLLLLDQPSTQGDSGGPVIDQSGRVIAITSATDATRGYHVTVGDQQWLRDILPENSILVQR